MDPRTARSLAERDYLAAFDRLPPAPFGVADEYFVEVLRRAIARGKPIGPRFNWWPDLPPGAVA